MGHKGHMGQSKRPIVSVALQCHVLFAVLLTIGKRLWNDTSAIDYGANVGYMNTVCLYCI